MAATFQLRFDPSGGQPIAEIGFQSAHGELTSLTLTVPCASFEEFSGELKVLRKELDKMEAEAKEKFSVESPIKNYNRLLKNLVQKKSAKFHRVQRRP